MKRKSLYALIVFWAALLHATPSVDCRLCHLQRSSPYQPKLHQPERQHQNFSTRHGKIDISCNSCHDTAHSNHLRTSREFPADFSNTSPVCQRCHEDVFKDWTQGIHGKRTGHWNGEKVKFQCIECHSPHSVKFKAMKASPMPQKPKLEVDNGE